MRENLKPMTVEEYLQLPYARVLVPDPDAGGYVATIREFPGCIAEGETADEALDHLHEAARTWIEAALHLGQNIPAPDATRAFSGKLALRMSISLHERLAAVAEAEGVSINQFICTSLAERVGAVQAFSYTREWLGAELTRAIEPICSSAARSITHVADAYQWKASDVVQHTVETLNSLIEHQAFSYEPFSAAALACYDVVHSVEGRVSFTTPTSAVDVSHAAQQTERAA